MSKTPLIAIVDDDESVGEAIQGLLKALGFATGLFLSAEAFLQFVPLADVGCLITDIQLPGMSGAPTPESLDRIGLPNPDHRRHGVSRRWAASAACRRRLLPHQARR
ncbi:MAG: response regulator [Acetobacteraceae bacterium]